MTHMDGWFDAIAADCELSPDASQQLRESGFVVMPDAVPLEEMASLGRAYDVAFASAAPEDVGVGGTSIRVSDFVNRGAAFDALYLFPPLLAACCRVIGQPFKLSTMLARTVRSGSPAQDLHVDFARDLTGFPMVGFILMVDEFRPDNGATRFIPGSHAWSTVPETLRSDRVSTYDGQRLACGPAGSIILYNGSAWHGHTANSSREPRRSIQGAYIRRTAPSAVSPDLPSRMTPQTLARIGPLAKYLILGWKT
jgi:hypothetical protein